MTSLGDSAPVRWLRRLRDFLRRYRNQIKSYTQPPTVSFDAERVRIVEATGEDFGFRWDAVRRIGYRTIDAWGPDHFIEFHLTDGQFVQIGTGYPGAVALCRHVDRLPDTRFIPGRGALANVVGNDSIIIWPSREAGGSLDDCVPQQPADEGREPM